MENWVWKIYEKILKPFESSIWFRLENVYLSIETKGERLIEEIGKKELHRLV